MSEFFDSQAAGLAETIAACGDSFTWKGNSYAAIVDHMTHNVTTLKSLFTNAIYPKCGDAITVAGRTFQITRKGNSEIKAVGGGYVEDPPFVDDPSDPSLDLTFDKMIKR